MWIGNPARSAHRLTDRVAVLTQTARALSDADVEVEDIGVRRPTLDDVFLRLTGHRAGEEEEEVAA